MGRPTHDDITLFEFLILEGAQAGLSWDTILKKRENYRAAFDSFDPKKIARYDRRKIQSLMNNAGHNSQPSEDCLRHPKCKSIPQSARRIRIIRRLHLAIHRRITNRELADARRSKSQPAPQNRTP